MQNIIKCYKAACWIVCYSWRARMILSGVKKADWPMLRLKVAAAEELMGKRQDWGQSRPNWRGSYLAGVSIIILLTGQHAVRITAVAD